MRPSGQMNRCGGATVAAVLLGVIALLAPPSPARAQAPAPGHDRMSLEASVSPLVLGQSASLTLCVQNVNRRTDPGMPLLPDDEWSFRIEDGAGTFAAGGSCHLDLATEAPDLGPAVLVCTTERASREAIDRLVAALAGTAP